MEMNSIKTVGLGIIYMALISCIILFSVIRKKENIIQKSQIAFYTAIGKEKKLFIQKVFINFDSQYSPDTIPASDKIEWANQLYLTMEDSCRHRLDSLFNDEMARQGLNLQTAITYTYQRKQKGDGPDCEGIRILALLSSFRQYYSLFAGIIECNGTCLFLHEKTH